MQISRRSIFKLLAATGIMVPGGLEGFAREVSAESLPAIDPPIWRDLTVSELAQDMELSQSAGNTAPLWQSLKSNGYGPIPSLATGVLVDNRKVIIIPFHGPQGDAKLAFGSGLLHGPAIGVYKPTADGHIVDVSNASLDGTVQRVEELTITSAGVSVLDIATGQVNWTPTPAASTTLLTNSCDQCTAAVDVLLGIVACGIGGVFTCIKCGLVVPPGDVVCASLCAVVVGLVCFIGANAIKDRVCANACKPVSCIGAPPSGTPCPCPPDCGGPTQAQLCGGQTVVTTGCTNGVATYSMSCNCGCINFGVPGHPSQCSYQIVTSQPCGTC